MKFVYLLTRSLAQGIEQNWTDAVNPDMALWKLVDPFQYKEVYIKLHVEGDSANPFYIKPSALLPPPFLGVSKTLKQIFDKTYISNPFTPETGLEGPIKYLRYRNARQDEYVIIADTSDPLFTPSNPFQEPTDTPGLLTPITDLPDLLLARPRYYTDMSRIHTHALVSVNGYLHQTALAPDTSQTVFVKEGGTTAHVSGLRPDGVGVAVLSFENVGEIKKYALADLTIGINEDEGFYHWVEFQDVPESLTGKTVLLSIGGYLIFPNQTNYSLESPTSFAFDVRTIGLAKKILEASRFIDLSSLGLPDSLEDIEEPELTDLLTDGAVEAFLKLSQSFLIVVPKQFQTVYSTPLRRFNNERVIDVNYEPCSLLRSEEGRLLTYWPSNRQTDKNIKFAVVLREFDHDVDLATSETHKVLKAKFPNDIPTKQTIVDEFISVGFYNLL